MKRLALVCLLLGFTRITSGVQVGSPSKSANLVLRANRASARGYIGGESHDRYSIFLKRGARTNIQLKSPNNSAEFLLSVATKFAAAEPVRSGAANEKERSWTGVIPQTRRYYIFVTAYPDAKYELAVTSY